jgi:hypothetical protein
MPEQIAMTPPDINGDQVVWGKSQLDDFALYLPSGYVNDEVQDILTLPVGIIKQEELIGVGSECNTEAGAVYRVGKYAVKIMPMVAHHRALSMLISNLCLSFAVTSQQTRLGSLAVVTPTYFGLRAGGDVDTYDPRDLASSTSVVIMSDESTGRIEPEGNHSIAELLRSTLIRDIALCFGENNPGILWDIHPGNILVGEEDLVVLDANGCAKWEQPVVAQPNLPHCG